MNIFKKIFKIGIFIPKTIFEASQDGAEFLNKTLEKADGNKKVDEVYYNYNTTQNLTSFKLLLQTLNSQQFLLYQPIRNNLISQLKLATTVDEVNIINNLVNTAFGDIIDETTTIVNDGE